MNADAAKEAATAILMEEIEEYSQDRECFTFGVR